MTIQPLLLDPEVEIVLREVAADPRSKLLRVKRPAMIHALLESQPVFGPASAGMTKAERHLVQAHRAEIAYALISVSWYLLTTGSETPNLFSRQGAPGREIPTPSRADCESLLALLRSAGSELSADELEACAPSLLDHESSARTAVWCCNVAQRICPTYQAQVHACAGLITSHRLSEASAIAEGLLAEPHANRVRAVTHTNLGLINFRAGRTVASLAAYEDATRADPAYAVGACNRLLLALQVGDEARIREAAQWVDRHVEQDDPNAARLLAHQHQNDRDSRFAVSLAARERLLAGASALSRRFAHVQA